MKSMENLSGTQLGKYSLIRRLARGGMADVYRARRVTDGEEVALKVMRTTVESDEEFGRLMSRFEQEARIVAGMRHNYILPLYDYGHDRGFPYIAMKLVEGGTLAEILRQGPLNLEHAGGWIFQIASALDHAHANGVIHRDLKPTNILLDTHGNAYLSDFGIAKVATQTSSFTVTGNVLGTPTYMAPEQWRSEELSPQTDVYGLGVLSYLMLTGKPPFEADTPHSLMYKHLNDPPPSMQAINPQVTPAVELVINKALAKRVADRYSKAVEFSHDFQRALRGQETLAQRENHHLTQPASAPRPTTTPEAVPVQTQPPSQSKSNLTPNNINTPPPKTLPPPVYGPAQIYNQQRLAQAPPSPYGHSQPIATIRPPKSRRWLWPCGLVSVVGAILIGIGLFVWQAPNDILPSTFSLDGLSGENTAVPTATFAPTPSQTPLAGSQPLVVINFPETRSIFPTGDEVTLGISASDTQGITRLEIRRFGFVIDTILPDTGSSMQVFTIQYKYPLRQVGRHVIEVVPYRGSIRGDSAIIELIAQ